MLALGLNRPQEDFFLRQFHADTGEPNESFVRPNRNFRHHPGPPLDASECAAIFHLTH